MLVRKVAVDRHPRDPGLKRHLLGTRLPDALLQEQFDRGLENPLLRWLFGSHDTFVSSSVSFVNLERQRFFPWEWQRAVQQELAGKEENLAYFRSIKAAAERPGFFGDVRRAVALSRRPTNELADEIGVAPQLLSDFRAGDAELPAAALDRLIETLGLRLMQEIAR